jgi:3-oxoacyl-[acyl-carrier protein] reductase
MSAAGASVVISDIDGDVAEASAKGLGGPATAVQHDVSNGASGEALAAAALKAYGRIDILVNNAGVGPKPTPVQDLTEEEYDRVMNINAKGVFLTTKAVVPALIEQKSGRVINISSIVGLSGNPGQVNYAASKAALIGFTKSLALEIGSRNVTVNAIAPGFIQTAMTDAMTDEARKTLEGRIALHRLGTPDDIAYAVAFLASEQAGYITGTVLNVSGGLYT